LPAGTTINDIVVGAGGAEGGIDGVRGGAGAAGRVSITCSTTGTPPANNRGVLFLDSGAYSSDSNFVFDASNRLGVGTTAPRAKLEVSNGTSGANGLNTDYSKAQLMLTDGITGG